MIFLRGKGWASRIVVLDLLVNLQGTSCTALWDLQNIVVNTIIGYAIQKSSFTRDPQELTPKCFSLVVVRIRIFARKYQPIINTTEISAELSHQRNVLDRILDRFSFIKIFSRTLAKRAQIVGKFSQVLHFQKIRKLLNFRKANHNKHSTKYFGNPNFRTENQIPGTKFLKSLVSLFTLSLGALPMWEENWKEWKFTERNLWTFGIYLQTFRILNWNFRSHGKHHWAPIELRKSEAQQVQFIKNRNVECIWQKYKLLVLPPDSMNTLSTSLCTNVVAAAGASLSSSS